MIDNGHCSIFHCLVDYSPHLNCGYLYCQTDVISSPSSWTVASIDLESRLADLQCRYDQLAADKEATESRLRAEVKHLQHRVEVLSAELTKLRSVVDSSATQLSTDPDQSINALLERLRSEYDQLLHRQIADVRDQCNRLFMLQNNAHGTDVTTEKMEDDDTKSNECSERDISAGVFVDGGMTEHVVKYHASDDDAVGSEEYEIAVAPLEESSTSDTGEFTEVCDDDGSKVCQSVLVCVRNGPMKRPNDGDLATELNGNERSVIVLKQSKLYCSQ